MTFNKYISMIENDSLEIARRWAKGMLTSKFTKTYRELPEEKLTGLGKNVYDNLARWLDRQATRIEIGNIYAEIGKQRYHEGYPLCEVLYAVHYIKRNLSEYIASEGVLPDAVNLYQTMEFMGKLSNFFDIATFYLTRGFQEALYRKAIRSKGINEEQLKDIFPPGSFYYEKDSELESFERLLDGFNLFKIK